MINNESELNTAIFKHGLPPGECASQMHFVMQDNYHQFTLRLETLLLCLQTAEREGEIPPLPETWWLTLQAAYPNLRG